MSVSSLPLDAAPSVRLKFNPLAPDFRRDPYPVYRQLREKAPYLRTLGTLTLSRYQDVAGALRDRRLSVDLIPRTAMQHARKLGVRDLEQVSKFMRNSIVFTDNPDHARLRRLVSPAFAPSALEALKTIIRSEVTVLLDAAEEAETLDVVGDLAAPLPLNVLCAWMGVPVQHRGWIREHVHTIRYLLDPGMMTKGDCTSVVAALAALTAFFLEHVRALRTRPDRNLIALLSQATSGDDRLSETEVAFACIMCFVAGNETTQCVIGNTINALTRFPEQERLLREDLGLAGGAIEESIRYDAPLQMTKRLVTAEMDINGCAVKAGEPILLCLGAANRDPTAFPDPDTFLIQRANNQHLGFGHGMHACLGGALARLQAEMCIIELLERFERIERVQAEDHWQSHSLILRGLDRFPVRLVPRRFRA